MAGNATEAQGFGRIDRGCGKDRFCEVQKLLRGCEALKPFRVFWMPLAFQAFFKGQSAKKSPAGSRVSDRNYSVFP